MLDGANLVYMKAIIQGVHSDASALVDIDNDGSGDIPTRFGHPTFQGMVDTVDLSVWYYVASSDKFYVAFPDQFGGKGVSRHGGLDIRRGPCRLRYNQSNADGVKPSVNVFC
jgi:hypothetical protein